LFSHPEAYYFEATLTRGREIVFIKPDTEMPQVEQRNFINAALRLLLWMGPLPKLKGII
jgi:hypothetical protein